MIDGLSEFRSSHPGSRFFVRWAGSGKKLSCIFVDETWLNFLIDFEEDGEGAIFWLRSTLTNDGLFSEINHTTKTKKIRCSNGEDVKDSHANLPQKIGAIGPFTHAVS